MRMKLQLLLLFFVCVPSSVVLSFKTLFQKGHDEDHCETVLDDVMEEKCETVIKDHCYVKGVTKCDIVQEKECHTIEEEKCAWVTENKCLTHPVPFCKLEWEKVCSNFPQCSTHYEKICEPVEKQECVEVHDKQCTVGVKKVCQEVAVKHESGYHSKGEVEPVEDHHHSLHKRSLELLLNKLDFKAKKLQLKREKLIKHFALKAQAKGHVEGHEHHAEHEHIQGGHGHVAIEAPIVHTHPKDVHIKVEHPQYETVCHEEPTEHCSLVPRQACHTKAVEECHEVPRQECHDIEKCIDIPKKNCGISEKETCIPLPAKKCGPVPKVVCKDVPQKVCHDVPHEYCDPVPGKECKKVLVKRPRQVCLPPKAHDY